MERAGGVGPKVGWGDSLVGGCSWLSLWRGLQSRRHLTGGGGSGNAADAGRDRFVADGAAEGGPQPAGVNREGGCRRCGSGEKHRRRWAEGAAGRGTSSPEAWAPGLSSPGPLPP